MKIGSAPPLPTVPPSSILDFRMIYRTYKRFPKRRLTIRAPYNDPSKKTSPDQLDARHVVSRSPKTCVHRSTPSLPASRSATEKPPPLPGSVRCSETTEARS